MKMKRNYKLVHVILKKKKNGPIRNLDNYKFCYRSMIHKPPKSNVDLHLHNKVNLKPRTCIGSRIPCIHVVQFYLSCLKFQLHLLHKIHDVIREKMLKI